MIAYTILGVPYSSYSIMGPKTLFQLFWPLSYLTQSSTEVQASSSSHASLSDVGDGRRVGTGTSAGEVLSSVSLFCFVSGGLEGPKPSWFKGFKMNSDPYCLGPPQSLKPETQTDY